MKYKLQKVLNRGSQVLELDLGYFIKGGFWLGLGQAVSYLCAFLLAVVFARQLDQATYGNYRYVFTILATLGLFSLPGIDSVLTQAVARGMEGSFLKALKIKLRWSLLASLLSLILAGYYYFFQINIQLTLAFLIVSFFLPSFHSFSLYEALLGGKKLFKLLTYFTIIYQIISSLAIGLVLLFLPNFYLLVLVSLAPLVILRLFFLKAVLRQFPPNQKEDSKTISYGKHLSLINVLVTIAKYLDRLLVFNLLGPASLAVYSFAIAPVEQMKGLFKHLLTLILPKLSQKSFKEIDNKLARSLFKLFFLGAFLTIGYFFIAPWFYLLFFPKYLDSVPYSRLFAPTICLQLIVIFLTSVTGSKITKMPKSWLYWGLAPQILLIASLVVFINLWGIEGVIMSRILFLISVIILSLVRWQVLKNKIEAR